VNPVTRKSENAKMHDRKKEKRLLRGERFDFCFGVVMHTEIFV
jgi:hypothetical protein